jgi:hypothetical protein
LNSFFALKEERAKHFRISDAEWGTTVEPPKGLPYIIPAISCRIADQIRPPFREVDKFADRWFDRMEKTVPQRLRPLYRRGNSDTGKIKIALLCTGVDLRYFQGEYLIDGRNFTDEGLDDIHDEHGSGTHMAHVILSLTWGSAKLFIAKIATEGYIQEPGLAHIAHVGELPL